ncbi:MAG: DUF4369 domain-containing protein [Prevotella sp.]|nr:DUF4369 domain-containing protein [Prevotella sp.]
MKRHALILLLGSILVLSCGTDSRHFRLEGRLMHIGQSEFYIYSPDGMSGKVDTIKVEAGRFAYETVCEHPMTLLIVFPNFTEQPVFAQPGKSVSIRGDASHLKEMTVSGTKENKLMNQFREQIANASPPDITKYARQFIEDHPASIVGGYLVSKYFIQTPQPDYREADRLVALMLTSQTDNNYLRRLHTQLQALARTAPGSALKGISEGGVATAPVAVVSTWATWQHESMAQQRILKRMKRRGGDQLALLSINLDGNKSLCDDQLKRDSIGWTNICDPMLFEGKLIQQLGLTTVPDNILLQRGRVVARSLTSKELEERLKTLLP